MFNFDLKCFSMIMKLFYTLSIMFVGVYSTTVKFCFLSLVFITYSPNLFLFLYNFHAIFINFTTYFSIGQFD